uniref:Uncharacterized protein n=1 Tax=Timema douglasi TaxID=61478 RepID=A0A7R8VT21_TIMDO|nr:unnamed protein product [Timema douglasi]
MERGQVSYLNEVLASLVKKTEVNGRRVCCASHIAPYITRSCSYHRQHTAAAQSLKVDYGPIPYSGTRRVELPCGISVSEPSRFLKKNISLFGASQCASVGGGYGRNCGRNTLSCHSDTIRWAVVVEGTVGGIRSRVIPTPLGCVSGRGLWKEPWEEYALVPYRHHSGALVSGGCGRNRERSKLSCHSDTILVRIAFQSCGENKEALRCYDGGFPDLYQEIALTGLPKLNYGLKGREEVYLSSRIPVDVLPAEIVDAESQGVGRGQVDVNLGQVYTSGVHSWESCHQPSQVQAVKENNKVKEGRGICLPTLNVRTKFLNSPLVSGIVKVKSGLGLYKSHHLRRVQYHSKMNCVLILCVIAVFLGLTRSEEKYATKYDNVDLDGVLNNDRLLKGYVKCLMDDGPCTADAKELKDNIPDALTNGCSKCSDKQREGTKKVIRHLYSNKQDIWRQLQDKYDPEHVYLTKYGPDLEKL